MNIVTNYVRNRLAAFGIAGHGEMNVCWSLSHCQGDGIAFYHNNNDCIPTNNLIAMTHRFFTGAGDTRFALLRAINKGVGARITHDGRYCHERSMDTEADYVSDLTEEEESAFVRLTEKINEEIMDVSRTIRDEAYEIVDCARWEREVVREYRTKRYLLRVSHLPDDLDHLDVDEETVEDMAAGNVEEVFCLHVALYEVDEDEEEREIADDYLGGLFRYRGNSNRHAYSGYLKGIVNELCRNVRPPARQRRSNNETVLHKAA